MITTKELADIAKVNVRTILRRIKDGTIKVERKDGYHVLIDPRQFDGNFDILLKRSKRSETAPLSFNLKSGKVALIWDEKFAFEIKKFIYSVFPESRLIPKKVNFKYFQADENENLEDWEGVLKTELPVYKIEHFLKSL